MVLVLYIQTSITMYSLKYILLWGRSSIVYEIYLYFLDCFPFGIAIEFKYRFTKKEKN